jgi:RND superfamily putative drug exporter
MRRLADVVVRWPVLIIAFWVALAVALPLSLPNLNDMAQKNPLAMLPADAPSTVAAREMTDAFQESGTDNLLLVVLTDEQGLSKKNEATYRKLVEALRRDQRHVLTVQDFISTPSLL